MEVSKTKRHLTVIWTVDGFMALPLSEIEKLYRSLQTPSSEEMRDCRPFLIFNTDGPGVRDFISCAEPGDGIILHDNYSLQNPFYMRILYMAYNNGKAIRSKLYTKTALRSPEG